MRHPPKLGAWLLSAAVVPLLLPLPAPALAEEDIIEELIVTGTRRAGVAPTETMSPVDVFGGERVKRQGAFDLTDALSAVSPSLNTQRFPIADGTAIIRPVSLRNLSPDHTLVLMNGTRRHKSALVNLQLAPLGTVNQGSQGVDWSVFPAASIARVEVLRDGASAQYGSDAIAGVINVILKNASEGAEVSAQYGEYSEGDGERFTISANVGLPLSDRGFVNITAEYSESDITARGNPRPDAVDVGNFLMNPGVVPLGGFGQRWGDPDVEAIKFLVNAGIEVSDTVELYGVATYSENDIISDFFYRTPVLPPAAGIEARTTLQIDADGDFLPDPAPQQLVDDILAQGLTVDDYLVADAGSASGYVLLNPIFTQFPGGYNPDFGADIEDFSFVFGARGELTTNLTFDIRGRFAENEVDYTVSETINPSLGRLSPLSFRPGTLTQEESGINVDFVKTFDDSPLNIAFGAEWRNETYEIGAGDLPSIQAGPTAAIFGVGSDGFQGFPVESSGDFESDSWAAYVDFETDFTDQFSAALALRYEDYDEFDTTFDYKVSGRFELTDNVAVRATYSTGFRTPTPGQVHTLNITTTSDSTGALIPNGTYPVDHPVAMALGSRPLTEEESDSFTIGLVAIPWDNTTVTLDYYQIDIEDRLALLNNTVGAAEVLLLQAAGIPNAALLLGSSANFFVNGFDSEITGIDLTVTHIFEEVMEGTLVVDFRHNWNEQEVSNVTPGTINASRVYDLENQSPENSTVITFDYTHGELFDGLVRFRYYGDWSTTGGLFSPGDASDQYDYDGEFLVDIEVGFNVSDHFRVSAGGENVFDQLPDKEEEPVSRFLGVDHSLTSPFGFNGAFWYLRLTATM
ncbi:MAG: TonB-dependent receptor [Gammaproteobacteria bacterium]|nr:TonB-dependent receptor [Gammaproteobacteria bacterium]